MNYIYMSISKSQYSILLYAFIAFIILVGLFKWIDYLVDNGYFYRIVKEGYTNTSTNNTNTNNTNTNTNNTNNTNNTSTSTVNLPLNTTTSCSNNCGPTARCSITGQQCTADIDCPGCQPNLPPSQTQYTDSVPGADDAGKLTGGVTPNYSTLTSDIGSTATIYNNKFSKSLQPNFGLNTWSEKFNEGKKLFDERYKPSGLQNMPTYPNRYSASGQFEDEGPLSSNAYLN